MAVRNSVAVLAFTLSSYAWAITPPPPTSTISVNEARTLPSRQLARELLGERLGSNVIDAVRHEYESRGSVPRSVDFYTRPELPWPRINGICRTDVITIEYDWFDFDTVQDSTPLRIAHVEATSRYLAFPMPTGEPGSPENEHAQETACANFATAREAFRAPSAGDAQWLAAIESEYRRTPHDPQFHIICRDVTDSSCTNAAGVLPTLPLNRANDVRTVMCPTARMIDQIRYCYRITFPYAGTDIPEWMLSVTAGMRDGMAPVQIRSLTLEHVQQTIMVR